MCNFFILNFNKIFAVDLVNASAPVCISVCTHALHRCEQLEWSSESQCTPVGAVVHSGPAAVHSFPFLCQFHGRLTLPAVGNCDVQEIETRWH